MYNPANWENELKRRKNISETMKKVRAKKYWSGWSTREVTFTPCITCGEGFRRNSIKNIYCSRSCRPAPNKGIKMSQEQLEKISGEKANAWKGGISSLNEILRHSAKYKDWRETVFERDNYTCQSCGIRGGKLNADHIKQFAYYKDLRFNTSNGKTLCFNCHRTTSSWGRRVATL